MLSVSNLSGEILAKEGNFDSPSTITDIVATIWTDYNATGEECFKEEKLNYLIVENEDSFIISTHLYSYIVTIQSQKSNIGMLKIHLEAVVKLLQEKFADFKDIIEDRNVEISIK